MRRRPLLKVDAKYNDWTVVEQISLDRALCRCKCGNTYPVIIKHMLADRSQRCRTCGNGRPSYKWRPPLFDETKQKYPSKLKTAVTDAIARCTDTDHRCYDNWGGRNISVYQEWLSDPRLFIEYLMTLIGWDNPSLLLDRIDNNGHYEPGNLRFVTMQESCQNQRHPGAPTVLTSEQVAEARRLRETDVRYWTYTRLGVRYNVSRGTVFIALTGKVLKHLEVIG